VAVQLAGRVSSRQVPTPSGALPCPTPTRPGAPPAPEAQLAPELRRAAREFLAAYDRGDVNALFPLVQELRRLVALADAAAPG
jgi:hypothetical protein